VNIIIIISGFGIYGAAVVPDSGVGNTLLYFLTLDFCHSQQIDIGPDLTVKLHCWLVTPTD